jgi:hypothetical protein
VERDLRAGNYLKGDVRPLSRILDDDSATIAHLDMDLDEICNRMRMLYEEGRAGLGDRIIVDDAFEVVVTEHRGIVPCPWRDQFAARNGIVEAVNLKNGICLRFSLLGWHMICSHSFFQGKGSPFRIEPKHLHEFFQQ